MVSPPTASKGQGDGCGHNQEDAAGCLDAEKGGSKLEVEKPLSRRPAELSFVDPSSAPPPSNR